MAKMKKTRLLLTIIGIAPLIMAATHRPENMIIYGYDKVTAKVSEVNIDDSGLNRIEVYNDGDGYVTYDGSADICFTIHEDDGGYTGSCYGALDDIFFTNQVLGPGETATYTYKDALDRSVGDELDISTFCLGNETIAHVSNYQVDYNEDLNLYLFLDIYENESSRHHVITVVEAEYDGKAYSFMVTGNGLIAKGKSIIDVNKLVIKNFRFFSTSYEDPITREKTWADIENHENLMSRIEIIAGISVLTIAVGCGVAAIVVPKAIRKKKVLEEINKKED